MSYMKVGESVTVEAGVNGFIIHSEEGPFIAPGVQELVDRLLRDLSNHHQIVEEKQQAEQKYQEALAQARADVAAESANAAPEVVEIAHGSD